MAPTIDHLALPSHEPEAAARWLATILGAPEVTTEGPDDDMFNVVLGDGSGVLFVDADPVPSHHLAFRVDSGDFAATVDRLRTQDIVFGNDPEDATNGETADFLGGTGRVYFTSADGHLFEVCAP